MMTMITCTVHNANNITCTWDDDDNYYMAMALNNTMAMTITLSIRN